MTGPAQTRQTKRMVAKFVKELSGFTGAAKLYSCDPPMKDYDDKGHRYVIVSAANAMFSGPETYIFPGDKSGNVVSWSEMPGSFKGSLNHAAALRNAGYQVKP